MPEPVRRFLLVLLAPAFVATCGTSPGFSKPADAGDGCWTSYVADVPDGVDILFVVDNSPSMDPKQAALTRAFPRLLEQLQKLPSGLPDIHIGVVSSDIGAGTGETGVGCGRVLGDRGLLWGNDPTPGALATVSGAPSNGCGLNPGARWISDVQDRDGVARTKNYTGNLTDVFSCLAQAVGTGGCEYTHQLQSLRVALNPIVGDSKNPNNPPINPQNVGFLRDKDYLAIVIVTDQDDCSADPYSRNNDGMFSPITPADAASLRCAARGHVCNGQAIPDYDPTNGYSGTGFAIDFANCAAKEPTSPRDPGWLPLISVEDMIDSVNQVKARPQEQILVSGIIGWPEGEDLSGVQYQINKDSTSMPVEQQALWNYMPICNNSSIRSADGNIYKAYGGLRQKKFIDAYGPNGKVFSICNGDFTDAMTQTGAAILQALESGCLLYPLVESDSPNVQPQCEVFVRTWCQSPGQGDCLQSGYQETRIPECKDSSSGLPPDPKNPQFNAVPDASRPCWYLFSDPISGCSSTSGQRISALFQADQPAPPGWTLTMRCSCLTSQP